MAMYDEMNIAIVHQGQPLAEARKLDVEESFTIQTDKYGLFAELGFDKDDFMVPE